MKRNTAIPVAAGCALLGWFLPSLWLSGAVPRTARHIAPHPDPAHAPALQAFTAEVRAAGSAMGQFQAIVAGAGSHADGIIASGASLSGFNCEEAEELALRLAGGDLGLHVTDSTAFMRSLQRLDIRVQASALTTWSGSDPDAALRALFTPEGIKLASGCDYRLLPRLAERDPDKALQMLRSASTLEMQRGWSAVIGAFAKTDAARALSVLEAAPLSARRSGMDQLISNLAVSDPQAALEWVKGLRPELRSLVDTQNLFATWSRTDPVAAAAAWETTDKEQLRTSWVLAQQWAQKDPEQALKWAIEKNSSYFFSFAIPALVDRDPQRALAVLDTVQDSQRPNVLANIAREWASADFPAALAWARTLKPEERPSAFASMANSTGGLSEADRRAFATEAGVQTPAGFKVLWHTDPAEALRTFASLPVASQREVWQNLTSNLTNEPPAEVVKMMALVAKSAAPEGSGGTVDGDTFTAAAIPRLAQAWAARDPVAAGAWLQTLPQNDAQAAAANNLISVWSRYDPEGAAAWTQALPGGLTKDTSLAILASSAAAADDRAASLKWSALIGTAPGRERALSSSLQNWALTDPSSARAAASALKIDPDEKARILNELPK